MRLGAYVGPGMCGVYAIRAHGLPFVKIGVSRDILKRLNELKTGCPTRAYVYSYLPDGTQKDERALHVKLQHWRVGGEWFHWNGSVRSELVRFVRVIDLEHEKDCWHESRRLRYAIDECEAAKAKVSDLQSQLIAAQEQIQHLKQLHLTHLASIRCDAEALEHSAKHQPGYVKGNAQSLQARLWQMRNALLECA